MFCLFDIYSLHAACGCFLPRWRWYTLDIEWLYWGSEKGLSSSVFSRFGGGWFSLSVEIPLPAGQWFHTHPGPLWSHPALKWARSDWGHEWVWHLDPGQDRRVGCGSPRPWKSEVQFLEMNPRVQGGDRGSPAADTWWLSGSVVSGWEGLLVEHYLMKSKRRVSTSRALLAWLVDCHTVVSRFLLVESWPKACWRGGKIEVCFKRSPDLFGKEFALCSLSLVSPKEARRNGLCMRMGPL